jgi:parallel beta-helix repeat protein
MTKAGIASLTLFLIALIVVTTGGTGEERFPHAPISIRSDDDFTTANGVVTGCGTLTDPYVIANWTIDAGPGIAGTGVGIRIQGTSAHVSIRDCYVVGDSRRSTGVLLRDAAHVRVYQCVFTDLKAGLFIYQNPAAFVDENTFTDCRRGIEGTESNGLVITGNSVCNAREHGIFLWRCHDVSLHGNTLSDCSNGIYLDSCHRDRLDGNRVKGMDHGIFLWDCFDCTVVGNVLHACDLGLALVHTSERNTVFHNAFFENARPATCDETNNRWDGGYPIGGNFWGNEGLVDECSGPNQDQPGSDGIADTPVLVPLGNVDHYPLIAPLETDETG